ncbi:unnamed protein product [Blepharisma stoltei]|uniref:Golgi SNAP receptor complex member 1 n=1 Tax=Blepharisma stoltei TaxID=1481888 RepID=A0AAU9K9C6_9CILI|nr:unnamed protein product [Blepharisma stoltei]
MEDLKKSLRGLSKDLENKFEELESIQNGLDPDSLEVSYDGKNPENEFERKVEEILAKIKEQAEEMNKIAASHIEISLSNQYLSDFRVNSKRFLAIKNNIQQKRWQQKLMGKGLKDSTDDSRLSILFREGRSLDNSIEMGKNVLATTQEVSNSLAYQKEKLTSASEKVVRFAETIPGINVLLGRISRRKRFNAIVIGVTISVCACITLIYVL